MIRLAPLLVLALVIPGQAAFALDPEECVHERVGDAEGVAFRLSSGAPLDMGQGIVGTYQTWQRGDQEINSWSFDDCRYGRQMQIDGSRAENGRRTTSSIDPAHAMHAAITSTGQVTFEDLAALFGDWSSDVHQISHEACGCAAYYPELRGDRRPWRGWPLG
jgi:hypothetical protein